MNELMGRMQRLRSRLLMIIAVYRSLRAQSAPRGHRRTPGAFGRTPPVDGSVGVLTAEADCSRSAARSAKSSPSEEDESDPPESDSDSVSDTICLGLMDRVGTDEAEFVRIWFCR